MLYYWNEWSYFVPYDSENRSFMSVLSLPFTIDPLAFLNYTRNNAIPTPHKTENNRGHLAWWNSRAWHLRKKFRTSSREEVYKIACGGAACGDLWSTVRRCSVRWPVVHSAEVQARRLQSISSAPAPALTHFSLESLERKWFQRLFRCCNSQDLNAFLFTNYTGLNYALRIYRRNVRRNDNSGNHLNISAKDWWSNL